MRVAATIWALILVAGYAGCVAGGAAKGAAHRADDDATQTFCIQNLDLEYVTMGWSTPKADLSVDGHPLSIGGVTYEHGLGMHAKAEMRIGLDGAAQTFQARVGVDDESGTKGSVVFEVVADDNVVFTSPTLHGGDAAVEINVDLHGVKSLVLRVQDAGDGIDNDHADWADACITYTGKPPVIDRGPAYREPYILTPPEPVEPRFNGARVFGVRPGHPVLFTVAVSGARPMRFAAEGLPDGVTFDAESGQLGGVCATAGSYWIRLRASNAHGSAEGTLRLEVGDTIALTPPMGWNSWNCFGPAVTQEIVAQQAQALVDSGLSQYGWSYINVDDYWQQKPESDDPTLGGPGRDADGRIVPNPRFPDMTALAAQIHALGLKFGVYSSPGELTCGGCLGSYGYEALDAQSYAEWGVDYLKYDLCSYDKKMVSNQHLPDHLRAYLPMREALSAQDRDILYSLCQYGNAGVSAWGHLVGGECWRTTGDIWDSWGSMSHIGFNQAGLERFAGPGGWNDPDMLVVGFVGWGPQLRPSRLTPDEQYTHISLWCLLNAPLLIGCDLTQLDAFTLNLLKNSEVIAVNQDPLGRQAGRITLADNAQVFAKPMEDGSWAVGLFNTSLEPQRITVAWSELGLRGACQVRDVWRQQDLGEQASSFAADVFPHGVCLIRVTPVNTATNEQ